ncbi:MAG: translation initiation factor IF-3 [bacterium]|nr:translation initiation factor IF-3 [bacterium]
MNNQIRAKEVRVVDENEKQIGVMSIEDALTMARDQGLDLIQITDKVEPPVCKISEYGKYLYQQEKKAKKLNKKEGGELKEIRLSFAISQNDLETRAGQAVKFLSRGDRVRIALKLRGREKALEGYAREKVQKFLEKVRESFPVKTERDLKREPRGLTMIIAKG